MDERALDAEVVVVTGLSGAGKSTVLRALTDIGYFCVDNLPPSLVAGTVATCVGGGIERVALGIDIRVGAFLDAAPDALKALREHASDVTVLFLDAADEALVRRFSETRRPHPMLSEGPAASGRPRDSGEMLAVVDGVRLERARMFPIRAQATLLLDTTHMSVHELRRQVVDTFAEGSVEPHMSVRVMSFGFKHGIPLDADLVFDVRFLDNPHFVPALRDHTGDEQAVREFVLASPGAVELLEHLESLLRFTLPRYEREGKSYLTIAVGCTGGRHRSVTLAVELARRLASASARRIGVVHRDLGRRTTVGGAS
ncbi:MAG: RNase adapter RapZ [Deltaproteobacteria bacterium]|nr:RNase adapter RapZ [Deltaproteobacteria bacterium]